MIDGHTHILFGVDDGAKTMEESKKLLYEEVHQGIDTVILTPHYRKGMFESPLKKIHEHFIQLKQWQEEQLPFLTLILGMEIYWTEAVLDAVQRNLVLGLGNNKTYLIEFSKEATFQEIFDAVQNMYFLKKRVVIAHFERYDNLYFHKEDILALKEFDCLIQVNASSLLPSRWFQKVEKSKKMAQWLVRENIADVVWSDVHHEVTRPLQMKQAYQHIHKVYGQKTANQLFKKNSKFMMEGDCLWRR